MQMIIQKDKVLKAVVDFQPSEFFWLNSDTYLEDVFLTKTVCYTQEGVSWGKCKCLWLQDIKLGNLMVLLKGNLCSMNILVSVMLYRDA